MKPQNQRRNTILFLIVTAGVLILITAAGMLLKDQAVQTNFARKNLAPSREFLFGTDWMGRDMFARTLAGLSLEYPDWTAHSRGKRPDCPDSWNGLRSSGKSSRCSDFLVD